MTRLSILDLSPITQGAAPADSFRNSLSLAQHAEAWGYNRYWVAEHHGMAGIASAATSVLVGHIAGGTHTIRVGAGGIMLPNHSPLVIAEQFGTLEALYPKRIDLGVGRAPGSDQMTARAMRRPPVTDEDDFPRDVLELIDFMSDAPQQRVLAMPGHGAKVPVWILGSSLFGAQLAAALGLPFAFASHFAPAYMMQAIALYRAQFKPSQYLEKPYVMLGFSVFCADTDAHAVYLASSVQQSFLSLRSGRPIPLPPPQQDFLNTLNPDQQAVLNNILSCTAIGSPNTVKAAVQAFIAKTGADELMIAGAVFEHRERLKSYEFLAHLQSDITGVA
jgi:luciferase family oxidoreductase group 1